MYNPQSFSDELIKIAMDEEDKRDLKRALGAGALGGSVGYLSGSGMVHNEMGGTVPLKDTKGHWGPGESSSKQVMKSTAENLSPDTHVTSKMFKDNSTGKVSRYTKAVVDDVAHSIGKKKALRYGGGALGAYGAYVAGKKLHKMYKDKNASQEYIPGGIAEGMKDSEFIRDELDEGVKDESEEHTPIRAIAKEIAKDHLAKDPHYYSHMKKMERALEKKSADLTAASRDKIKTKNFAIPEEEKYPIHDAAHARNALARVSQFGTPEEKARVREAVARKWPGVVGEETKEDLEKESSSDIHPLDLGVALGGSVAGAFNGAQIARDAFGSKYAPIGALLGSVSHGFAAYHGGRWGRQSRERRLLEEAEKAEKEKSSSVHSAIKKMSTIIKYTKRGM